MSVQELCPRWVRRIRIDSAYGEQVLMLTRDTSERTLRVILSCLIVFTFAEHIHITSWFWIGFLLVVVDLLFSMAAMFLGEQGGASLDPNIKIFWGQSSGVSKYLGFFCATLVTVIVLIGLIYAYAGLGYVVNHIEWKTRN